ncbi:3343_t:CDS:2, partial [Dentiscutata heterogama]
ISIWTRILKDWDTSLSKYNKNILLLVDSVPVYYLEENVKLNHIRIEFLLQMPLCIFNLTYNSVYDKPNESPPAFTICDTIYFAADKKASILPINDINDDNNISSIKFQSIENKQFYELDDLIAELPINNPLSTSEFLHLDNVLPIEKILDDMISLQEGNHLAKSLVEFLLQQNDEFGVSAIELGI